MIIPPKQHTLTRTALKLMSKPGQQLVAVNLFEQALALRKSQLPWNDILIAEALVNLSRAYTAVGRNEDAMEVEVSSAECNKRLWSLHDFPSNRIRDFSV